MSRSAASASPGSLLSTLSGSQRPRLWEREGPHHLSQFYTFFFFFLHLVVFRVSLAQSTEYSPPHTSRALPAVERTGLRLSRPAEGKREPRTPLSEGGRCAEGLAGPQKIPDLVTVLRNQKVGQHSHMTTIGGAEQRYSFTPARDSPVAPSPHPAQPLEASEFDIPA